MGVTYAGGVILGADSRTSTGSYVANRVSDKIVPIHDYIWCCRSGSAADTQAVADIVKYYIGAHATSLGRLPKVKTVATLMQKICYENKDRLMAGVIVGLPTSTDVIAWASSFPPGGSERAGGVGCCS